MLYKTIKAKRKFLYLVDDSGNVYKVYNIGCCCRSGFYMIKKYRDGYALVRQFNHVVNLPYYALAKWLHFVQSKHPRCRAEIKKAKLELYGPNLLVDKLIS